MKYFSYVSKLVFESTRTIALLILSAMLFVCGALAQTTQNGLVRPRILGIAHVAIDVNDLRAASAFYSQVLGFQTPFSLQRSTGEDWIAYVKINDQQHVELFANSSRPDGAFDHIAFSTDDLASMRRYLISRGIKIARDIHQGRTGDTFLSINDPDKRLIEIVEYKAGSWTAQERAKGGNADHISHVAVPGGLTNAARYFYQNVLGFEPVPATNGTDLRMPGEADYIEFPAGVSQVNESCAVFLVSNKSLCMRP